jgi:PAS domain S-box-containing protein
VHQVELEMQNEELRETQLRLKEAYDQYTDLFDFAPVGYLLLDEEGIVKNINLTACILLGRERADIKDKDFYAYLSSGESDKLYLALREAFYTEVNPSFELLIKPNDRYSFTALFQSTLNANEDHTKSLCRLSMQDVTKLRKAETLQRQYENLQKEEENIQQYLDLAPIIFLLIDIEHSAQMINQKGCDILGYDRPEILGENWFENFMPYADKGNATNFYFENKKFLLKPHFECNVLNKNGGLQLVDWTNTSVLDKSGNLIGTLCAGLLLNEPS